MAVYTDNFNRQDGGPGANWAQHDGFGTIGFMVSSNRVIPGSNYAWAGMTYSAGTFADDQYSQIVETDVQVGVSPAPCVRMTINAGADTCYWACFSNHHINHAGAFYRISGGTWTQLGSNFNPTADYQGGTARLEASGTTLTAKFRDVSQGTRTDATYASGKAGLSLYAEGASIFDDWEGGDLAAAAVGNPAYAYAQQ